MENWTRYMQDYDGLQRLTVSPSAANSSTFYSELHHDIAIYTYSTPSAAARAPVQARTQASRSKFDLWDAHLCKTPLEPGKRLVEGLDRCLENKHSTHTKPRYRPPMISLGSEGFWMGDYGGVRVGRHVMLAHAEYPRKGPNPGALKTSLDTHTHRDTHTHTHTQTHADIIYTHNI